MRLRSCSSGPPAAKLKSVTEPVTETETVRDGEAVRDGETVPVPVAREPVTGAPVTGAPMVVEAG
jgi:hypothetical protein